MRSGDRPIWENARTLVDDGEVAESRVDAVLTASGGPTALIPVNPTRIFDV